MHVGSCKTHTAVVLVLYGVPSKYILRTKLALVEAIYSKHNGWTRAFLHLSLGFPWVPTKNITVESHTKKSSTFKYYINAIPNLPWQML